MSSANLDLVRSIYADWERGDWTAPPTWADPEIEFALADGPDPTRVTGVAEMVAAFTREFLSTWDHLRTEAQEYRELDDERILVFIHNHGRGRTSGMEIGQLMGTAEGANVWFIRDGKVVKVVMYWDRARALADLGLTPDTGT
ncbi:MAG: nuclear transport factor 2 family protein [Solirubrobacteraceae bacterium]